MQVSKKYASKAIDRCNIDAESFTGVFKPLTELKPNIVFKEKSDRRPPFLCLNMKYEKKSFGTFNEALMSF
jgi:hypothetical protein